MTRQGVLWDLDAVLVDTGEFHYQAWSGLLPEYGIPFTHESFRATFGMNNAGILATLLGHKPTPELLAEISDRTDKLPHRLEAARSLGATAVFQAAGGQESAIEP